MFVSSLERRMGATSEAGTGLGLSVFLPSPGLHSSLLFLPIEVAGCEGHELHQEPEGSSRNRVGNIRGPICYLQRQEEAAERPFQIRAFEERRRFSHSLQMVCKISRRHLGVRAAPSVPQTLQTQEAAFQKLSGFCNKHRALRPPPGKMNEDRGL